MKRGHSSFSEFADDLNGLGTGLQKTGCSMMSVGCAIPILLALGILLWVIFFAKG